MSDNPKPRTFKFYQLEDRVLLSGEGMEGLDVDQSVDTDLIDALLVQLDDAQGQALDSAAQAEQPAPHAPTNLLPDGEAISTQDFAVGDTAQRLEVIFVDERVDDADVLLSNLRDGGDESTQWLVIRLSADQDGVSQISETLATLSGVDSVHILSHGDGTGILLGNTRLDSETAVNYAGDIASWGHSLDSDADLLIYGCDLTSTVEGQDLIDMLAIVCDCDVATVSDDNRESDTESLRHEVVFVQGTIYDINQLTSDLFGEDQQGRVLHVVTLDQGLDGFDQIDAALRQYSNLDAIHFVTHGTDGFIQLGGSWLTYHNVTEHLDSLQSWGMALSQDGDILIYGCDVARGPDGVSLLEVIAGATDADVAASVDGTGDLTRGGNWDLEYTHGEIETANAFGIEVQRSYGGLLATFTVTNTNNSGAGSLAQAIIDANNNAGADSIVFNIGSGIKTINLTSALTHLYTQVTIDATTQSGYAGTPLIVLNGGGTVADGLRLWGGSGGSTVRGLVFNNFTGKAIDIASSNSTTIVGNYIGINQAGTSAAGNAYGINIFDSNNVVIGGSTAANRNIISGNTDTGVLISGTSTGNFIRGNYIGTNAAGTSAVGNRYNAIYVASANNTLGGATSGYGNVISGTTSGSGISLGSSATGTNIQGNYIGTNAAGTSALANSSNGIYVESASNTIGGSTTNARNIVSGNASSGIFIDTANNNTIQGNYVGLNAAGTTAIANGTVGIYVLDSTGTTIGGILAGQGNVVSGNTEQGIFFNNADNSTVYGNYVGTNTAGTGDVNGTTVNTAQSGFMMINGSSGNIVGNGAASGRNIFSGNNHYGAEVQGATSQNNTFNGNYFGTTISGGTALGNTSGGFSFWGSGTGNKLTGNVVSGNLGAGVLVGNSASGAQIQGNLIGVGADGSTIVGNTSDGIYVSMSSINTLIGTNADGSNDAAEANTISGNSSGIVITGSGTTGTMVYGNRIGTNATGLLDRGNNYDGVRIENGATNNFVGGSGTARRNIIAGNDQDGLQIDGEATDFNWIQNNWIGLGSDGTTVLGNGALGIFISGGADNTIIGGVGLGNVIVGSGSDGIAISGASSGTVIYGNYIGTNSTQTLSGGNNLHGIVLSAGATNNIVGGTNVGQGNVITNFDLSNTGYDGVRVAADASTGNAIIGNSIYNQSGYTGGGLGIDLGTGDVTANDTLDPDSGPNNLQNFPVVTSASTDESGTVFISGSINTAASLTGVVIHFYASPSHGDTSRREGKKYLGSRTVNTDASGNATFTDQSFSGTVAAGELITATATYNNNTSEYSASAVSTAIPTNASPNLVDDVFTVAPGTTTTGNVLANDSDGDGGTLTIIDYTNPFSGSVTYNNDGTFEIVDGNGYYGSTEFSYRADDGQTGLSRYYGFNGDLTDSVGGNDGTSIVGDTYFGEGSFGQGIWFDEASDYALIPDFTYNNQFTVSFDFRVDENSGTTFQYMYSHGTVSTANSLNIYLGEASHGTYNNQIFTNLQDSNDAAYAQELNFDISAIIGDGQWHNYTLTVSGAGSKVYLDGVLKASDATRGGDAIDPTTALYLGGRNDLDANRFYAGGLDSLRIHDQALAAAEVADQADIELTTADVVLQPVGTFASSSTDGGLSINTDGGDDVYLVTNQSPFSGQSQTTIEVEFSANSPATGLTTLFSYADVSNQDELFFGVDSGGELFFRTSENGGAGYGSITHATGLFDGETHTVAVTWENSTGILRFYVDGEELGLGRNSYKTSSTIDAGGTVVIGQHQGAPGSTFNANDIFSGTMYNVRVFDHVRTSEQLAASYRTKLPHDESGMLAQWSFNQLSTDGIVTDSVRGNNLTVKHTSEPGFTASMPELIFALDENATDGTFVGQVYGVDAQREAQIAAFLASDADLRYSAETGKFYKAVFASVDYATAVSTATGTQIDGVDGQLATIRSAFENEFVYDMVQDIGANAWLGGTDSTVEGEWRWQSASSDSDLFWLGDSTGYGVGDSYTNWTSGEPNDGGGDQDHAQMYVATGKWDDTGAASALSYVIEWDADSVLDASQATTYAVVSQTVAGAFAIDASTGKITVADGSLLDYETNATHTITIRTTDVDLNTYDEVFTVSLNDLAESNNAPTDLSSGIELNSDGGNDAYLISTNAQSIFGGLSELTIESTFFLGDTAQPQMLLSYDTATQPNALLVYANTTGSIEILINNDQEAFNGRDYLSMIGDGKPHHLAITWDSSSQIVSLFIDGEFQESIVSSITAGSTLSSDPTSAVVFGQEQDGVDSGYSTTQTFRGTLYDVRIWNEVRSESEIALNYQNKFDSGSLPSGLVANWQMDGFNGSNEVVDVVSGNNLSVGHATGTGFIASTPAGDLHISENATDGTSVGFVVPSDPDVSNDVVSDGSFTESTPSTTQFGVTGTFGDWTVTQASVDLFSTNDWESPLGGRVVNLDGSAPGAIAQTLTTVAGRQYQVVFALTGDFDGGEAVKNLRVSAAGTSADFEATQSNNWSWGETNAFEQRSFTFTADDITSVLQFQSLEGPTSTYGPYIADVQVIEIPAAVTTILNNDPTLQYNAATGKFYRYVDEYVAWSTARNAAQSAELNGVGGQLVTIRSAYENQLVRELSQTAFGTWLGGTDQNVEGDFYWQNGDGTSEKFWQGGAAGSATGGSYANFRTGEPDDFGNADFVYQLKSTGLWDDANPSSYQAYVIEWDASEVLSHFTFSLTNDAGGRFAIEGSTGEITIADGSLIDYETATSHNVTVQVTDAAGNTYSEVMSISVDNELDANQTVPGPQSVNEDEVLTFSAANGNAVSVSDSLAGTDTPMQVFISVNDGVLNLSQTTGLSILGGSNGSTFMTLQGTESDINAALEGLTFTPDADFNGSVTLNMTTSLGADMEGHYTFEGGNAVDQSVGISQNGTFQGNATTVIDPERGEVLSLDGNADAVQVAGMFGNSADITLAAWVNLTSPDTTGASVISLGDHVQLSVDDLNHGGTKLYASVYNGTSWDNVSYDVVLSGTGWHHVAFTFDDAANTANLYLDGEKVGSSTITTSISYSGLGTNTYIGSHGKFGTTYDFNGMIDDARVYTRALSANEIAALASDQTEVSGAVAITVDAVNDAPTFNNLDNSPTFIEGGSPVVLDADVTFFDVDIDRGEDSYLNIDLTLQRSGGADAEDVFSATGNLATITEGGNLVLSGNTIGTVVTNSGGVLDLRFNGAATASEVNEVLQSIAYSNNSDAPPASVDIAWSMEDSNGGSQGSGGTLFATGSTTVNIIDVDEPAFLTVPIAQSVNEDIPLTFSSGGGNAIVVESGSNNDPILTATLSVANGKLTLATTTGITFLNGTSNNSTTITISGSESNINAALEGLQFLGNANYNGSDTLTVTTGSAPTAEANLYARYEFLNGSLTDESGNGYDGTAGGDPTLTSDPERVDVLTFDGNDTVSVVSGTAGLGTEVTIAAWVKLDAGQTDAKFISIGDKFYVTLDPSTTSQGMAVTANAFSTANTNSINRIAGEGWHHVAATLNDVTNELNLYLDGVLIKNRVYDFGDINWGTGSQNITIGGLSGGAAFAGSLDDVRVYASELSRSEIVAMMGDQGYATDNVAITVNAINDAPVFIGLDGTPTFVEGSSTGVVLDANATYSDIDISRGEDDFNAVNLTLRRNIADNSDDVFSASGNLGPLTTGGTLLLSGVDIGDVLQNDSGFLNIRFNTTATQANVNEVMQSIAYSNTSDTPPSSVQIDWSMEDGNTSLEQGSGGNQFATGSTTVNITATNDAPVLTPYAPTLPMTEDSAAYSATVASLLGSSVTDVDGDPEGIAITAISGSIGTLEYSTDGTNWAIVGAVSDSAALLLRATDQLRFTPNGINGGSMNLTYRAWDQSAGTAGGTADTTTNGGSSPFSSATDFVTVNATEINDAPSGTDNTIAMNEDIAYTLTAADFGFNDVDGNSFDRVWITALPNQGQLLYNGSTFAVNNWIDKADIDLGLLTFEPANNANGSSYASFDFQVQDDGGTANGGVNRDASSNTITFDISAVNDAPVAAHGGVYTINEGDSLNLNASATTDVDGDTLTYRWDLDNDGQYDDLITNNATSSVSWATLYGLGVDDDGSYTIGLQVDDGAGGVVDTSTTLTIANVAPTLTATGAATSGGNTIYTLTLTDVDPGNDTVTQWIVNWGDGAIDTFVGDPSSVTHTYSNDLAGFTFDITVSAIDEDGQYYEADMWLPAYGGSELDVVDGYDGNVVDFYAVGDGLTGHANVVQMANGNFLISGHSSSNVLQYQPDGTLVGTFVSAGSGGLNGAAGMDFGADGNLYVASSNNGKVLRFDGTTGAFIDEFVSTGLSFPLGLTFGSDGNLFVASQSTHGVLKFDGVTGILDATFNAPSTGSTEDITFGPDGNIYVASISDGVVRLSGTTGAFIDNFVALGTGGLTSAAGVSFGPDGNLYVSDQDANAVRRYDGTTGAYIDDYLVPGEVPGPAYMTFAADHQVTVTNTNVDPVLTLAPGGGTYLENSAGVFVDVSATITDANGLDFKDGQLTTWISNNGESTDRLEVRHEGTGAGQVNVSGNNILIDGVTVGTIAGGTSDIDPLVVTFNANADQTDVEKVARRISFNSVSEDPSTAQRTISMQVTDGDGGTSSVDTRTENVIAVNDAPVTTFLEGPALNYTENDGAVAITSAITITDVDDTNIESAVIAITSNYADGEDVLAFIDQNGVTGVWDSGSGTLTLTGSATLAQYEAALRSVTFENTSDNPTTGTRTVSFTVSDGDDNSNAQSRDIAFTVVNDAPVNVMPGDMVTDVNTAAVLSGANAIQVSDVDAGASSIQVTLSATNGTMTLASTTGLTFTTGDGTADATIVVTGTVADINAALDGLSFNPTTSFTGTATVNILTEDLGNTGTGGNLTDSDLIHIQVGGVKFQQGVDGYVGTEDTFVRQYATNSSFGNDAIVETNNWSGFAEQGLIRFGNLFGSGIGQIPVGSTITNATLSVYVSHPNDTEPTSVVSLYKMNANWTEASTWNSMTGGIQTNGTEAAAAASDTISATDAGWVTFNNLAADVQQWVDGQPNYGWSLLTDDSDAWEFNSSENGSVTLRPYLTIAYLPPQPAAIDLDANNSSGATGSSFNGSFTENGGAVLIADSDATLTDSDSTHLKSMTVTISNLLDGTAESLAANTTGTSITASYDSGTGVLTLSGSDTVANYQTVLRTVTYDNSSESPDVTDRVIHVEATDDYVNSNVATATIDIIAVNDAPDLDTLGDLRLPTITEDDVNNAGVTVAQMLASDSSDPITDVDSGALEGIAITTRNNGRGLWEYSIDGGTNWSVVGTVSETEALLLRSTDLIRFAPDGENGNTTDRTLEFRAWDQTSGAAGAKVDTTTNGGSSAFSIAIETVAITTTDVNDAPVLDNSGSVTLTTQLEDAGAPTGAVGTVITDLVSIGGNVSDVDASPQTGVAITAADTTNGTWWYTTDGGTNWNALGSVSESSARVLNANSNTRIYFEADVDFNGTVTDVITFRAWDRSNGPNGSLQDASITGGTSAYSAETETADLTITGVNDAPHLLDANLTTNSQFATDLSGWTTSGNVDHDGTQVRFGQIGGPNGSLSQTITTVIGQTYVLKFDYGDRSSTATQSMQLNIDGATSLIDLAIVSSVANDVLQPYTYAFVADSTSTTLTFTDTSADHSGVRSYIDNVELRANATPLATLSYTENDSAAVIDSTIVIADVDDTLIESATVVISANLASVEDVLGFVNQNGISGTYDSFTGTLTLSGSATLTQYETALRSVTYANTSDIPSTLTRTVTFTVNDGDANSNTQTRDITIASVNDDPTNAGTLPTDITVIEDLASNVDLSAIDLSDVDAASSSLIVKLTTSTGGNLTATVGTGITIGNNGTGAITLTGSQADLNAYLNTANNVQYLHGTANFDGNDADTIQVEVNDNGNTGSGGGTDIDFGTVNVDITAVNDEEVLATNAGTSVAEGSTGNVIATADLHTTDVDNIASELVYTVDAVTANGTLRLSGVALGLSDTFTQADIDAGNVTYDHDGSQTTADSFDFTVDDGAGTTTSATFNFTVTNVNDPPVNTVPGAQSVDEDAVLAISGISVTDEDNNLSTVQLTVNNGVLNVTLVNSATISVGSNDSADLTLSGTLADINATLATLTYQGNLNFNGNDTLTVLSTDSDSATDSDSVAITVGAVNDTPVVTAPGSAYSFTEQGSLSIHGTGFSVADIDDNGGTLTATFSVGEGRVLIDAGDSGVTLSSGNFSTSGNSTDTVTFTGTKAQINALLSGSSTGTIVYSHDQTAASDVPSASTTITLTVNDQGNTGADPGNTGDASSEEHSASQTINVTSVNDAPNLLGSNLISNGTFDSDLTGWTTTGTVGYSFGRALLGGSNAVGPHTLSQTIATGAGETYVLEFDYRDNHTNLNQQLQVTVDGSTNLLSTEQILSDTDGSTFIRYRYTFTADSSSTTLTFTDTSDDAGSQSASTFGVRTRAEISYRIDLDLFAWCC